MITKPFELKATVARDLADKHIQNKEQQIIQRHLSVIEDKIQEYATEGKYSYIHVITGEMTSSALISIINTLKENGYKAEHTAARSFSIPDVNYENDQDAELNISWSFQ
jgi:hypothetical protein